MNISPAIIRETEFLFHFVLLGIFFTFLYDGFLILRRVFRHSNFWISLEDLLFWAACALGMFLALYEENDGILRWFAVLGVALGMFVYKKTVSRVYIRCTAGLLAKAVNLWTKAAGLVKKGLLFLLSPVCRLAGKGRRRMRDRRRHLKKRLTERRKEFKIILTKK